MNKTIKIAPSILSADFSQMGLAVKALEESGADMVHCDVMDGVFVNNISFGIKMIADIKKITTLPLDVHLMIVEPQKYVERFALAGADIISVHYEACKEKTADVLKMIKNCGVKCALAVNPDTEFEKIENLIPLCDMVLFMSVFPGFGGQKFISEVLEKIKTAYDFIVANGLNTDIEVDGGINAQTVKLVKSSGANVIVAGSAVFNSSNMKDAIQTLRD